MVTAATPHITNVTITKRANPDHGKSWDDGKHPFEWRVSTTWSNVDRPEGTGYIVGNPRLAERLRNAIIAGVVFADPEIKIDKAGKTYVSARSTVLGRMINADLRRLGF